jgi:hypothetical protein
MEKAVDVHTSRVVAVYRFTLTAIFGEKTVKNGKEYPSLVR